MYCIVSWMIAHGQSTLTSLPNRGLGTLSSVYPFNHERAPISHLQWLNALKANNWTNNNVWWNHQSRPDGTQHCWMALCHHEHGVAYGACCISYVHQCRAALYVYSNLPWSITGCFWPQVCIALEAVLQISYAKLAPWWALIWENLDLIQEIETKVVGGHSFKCGRFFARLQYLTM